MTFIGKLLVLVNVVVSIAFLTFGIGVYTQRIDWFNRRPEGGEEIKGKVSVLQSRLADLIEAKARAEARWKLGETALVALESERPARQKWYQDTLALIETGRIPGSPAPVQNPVRQLTIDPTGKIVTDQPDERKTIIEIRPGTPLLSLGAYNQLITDGHGEIQTAQDDLKKLIDEQKELTNKIIDTDQKGLRTLVREQIDIERQAADEVAYLQPYLTNRLAEAQLLGKRRDALQARLTELRRFYGAPAGQ